MHRSRCVGKAGVPKEIRDRIQNDALQDVSSKSYDRWTYMPEKLAANPRSASSVSYTSGSLE
jgi:hypothetical protein